MNAVTRRRALSLAAAAVAGTLGACSGASTDGAAPKSPSPTSGGGSQNADIMAHIDPVPGFASHPAWSSLHDNTIASLTPLAKGGAAWFAGRAWFLMTDPTADTVRAAALDPASKKVALSDPLPAGARDVDAGRDGSPWMTVSAPTPALLLRVGADLLTLSVRGTNVRVEKLPTNPGASHPQPVWIGDAVVTVQQNKTRAATGDLGDATNTLTPSYYLDAGKKIWVAMTPKHDGTIVGISARGGTIAPVELVDAAGGKESALWVGERKMTSGLTHPGGSTSAAGEYPFTSLAWSHDGTLLMVVDGIASPTKLVSYGPDGKARTGVDSTTGTWSKPGSAYVLLPNGMAYDQSIGQTRLGVYASDGAQQWDLINSTISPGGTIYASADPSPGDKTFPAGGSYVSEDGALDATKHTNKAAPVLVMPGGAGLFLEGSAQLLARS